MVGECFHMEMKHIVLIYLGITFAAATKTINTHLQIRTLTPTYCQNTNLIQNIKKTLFLVSDIP